MLTFSTKKEQVFSQESLPALIVCPMFAHSCPIKLQVILLLHTTVSEKKKQISLLNRKL